MTARSTRARRPAATPLQVLALILALGALLGGPAAAQEIRENDTLLLKNGRQLVGEIVADEPGKPIKFRQTNGLTADIERDSIADIIRRQSAQQAYEATAAKLGAGDADKRFALALWCIDHELLQAARAEVDKVLSADPKRAEAYILGLQACEEELARADEDRALVLYDAVLGLTRRAAENGAWSPRVGLSEARAFRALEVPGAALASAEKALVPLAAAAEPSPAQVYLLKECQRIAAEVLAGRGQDEAAIERLTRLLEADSNDFRALFQRGRLRAHRGESEAAEADLTKALTLEPAYAEAYVARAAVRVDRGLLKLAEADLVEALKLGIPDPRPARVQLGLLYYRAGKLKSAAREFLATRGEELYGPGEVGFALVLMRRDEVDRAVEALAKAETLLPKDGVIQAMKGQAFAALGRDQAAEAAYAEAIRLGFEPRTALRAMAELAAKRSDTRRAIDLLKHVCYDPSRARPDDLYRLGRLLVKAERIDEARAAFEAALKNDESHQPSLLGLGFLLYNAGDFADAKGCFEKVRAADPKNLYAVRALKNIEESRTRRVWEDRFQREGPEVQNRWTKKIPHGVRIELKDKKVEFYGTQRNGDFQNTELVRRIDDGDFVRFEATLNTDKMGDARGGIRFRLGSREVILFRDTGGGQLKAAHRTSTAQKHVVVDLGIWPGDGEHQLAIELEDELKGIVGLSVDGERKGEVKLPPIRNAKNADVVIYGQSENGVTWGLELIKVRVYVRKRGARKRRGGL